MDGQFFEPGSRVIIRNNERTKSLASTGPYTIHSLVPPKQKTASDPRRPNRLCRFREGRFRVQLATPTGDLLQQTFKPHELELIVELDSNTKYKPTPLPIAIDSEEVLMIIDEDSEKDDVILQDVCLPYRSSPTLSSTPSVQECDVLILGPHRITDQQLCVLETGEGELADSILDGFCFALTNSNEYPCVSQGHVELATSLSLACLLSAMQGYDTSGKKTAESKSSNMQISPSRFCSKWQRWAEKRRLVLGPYLHSAQNNHWILLAFCIKTRDLWLIDSLGQKASVAKSMLKLFRKCNEYLSGNSEAWNLHSIDHNLQTDDASCGLFVLEFIYCILENNGNVPEKIKVETTEVRSRVLHTLVNGSGLIPSIHLSTEPLSPDNEQLNC